MIEMQTEAFLYCLFKQVLSNHMEIYSYHEKWPGGKYFLFCVQFEKAFFV